MLNRVLAVSASPAIDRVVIAPGARSGGTTRVTRAFDTAGGKAIHVSTIAGILGAAAAAVVPVGGRSGERLLALSSDEPFTLHPVPISGATRLTTTVVDPGHGDVLELLEPSPRLIDDEVAALIHSAVEHAGPDVLAIVSGSAPADRERLPAQLGAAAKEAGATVVVDTSGVALEVVLAAGTADIVTPNLPEACQLLGRQAPPSPTAGDLAGIAMAVSAAGAPRVLLSAGEHGAVLVSDAAISHVHLPGRLNRVNAVGCGDALLGGLAAGLLRSMALPDAVRLGVAAASNKLGKLHPARVDPSEVDSLLARVVATELDLPGSS